MRESQVHRQDEITVITIKKGKFNLLPSYCILSPLCLRYVGVYTVQSHILPGVSYTCALGSSLISLLSIPRGANPCLIFLTVFQMTTFKKIYFGPENTYAFITYMCITLDNCI